VKAAVFTMAHACGIPYLMISSCRIRDLHVVYDNFSMGTPRSILSEMRRLAEVQDPCDDAASYIDWLKREHRPAYSDFERTFAEIKAQMRFRSGSKKSVGG